MRPKLLDLHLVVASGVAILALTPLAALHQLGAGSPRWAPLLGALSALTAIIGGLALLAPGYALTAAFLPRATLGVVTRLTYSLGCDFALVAVGGIALDVSPWGLTYTSWASLLGGVTLLAGVTALTNGDGRALSLAPLVRGARALSRSARRRLLRGGVLTLVALLGVGAAIALSSASANQALTTERTAIRATLWMLPITQHGAGAAVRVGVQNFSASEAPFRLTLAMQGVSVKVWPTLDLRANQSWETTIAVATLVPHEASGPMRLQRLTATLAWASAPTVAFRQGSVWVSAPSAPSVAAPNGQVNATAAIRIQVGNGDMRQGTATIGRL